MSLSLNKPFFNCQIPGLNGSVPGSKNYKGFYRRFATAKRFSEIIGDKNTSFRNYFKPGKSRLFKPTAYHNRQHFNTTALLCELSRFLVILLGVRTLFTLRREGFLFYKNFDVGLLFKNGILGSTPAWLTRNSIHSLC